MKMRTFFTKYRVTIVISALLVICGGLTLLVGDLWVTNTTLTREMNILHQRAAIAEARANGLIGSVAQPTTEEKTEATTTEVPADTVPAPNAADHYDGPKNAPVAIIEYSDLECPFCKRHAVTLAALKSEYGDKVVHIFRNYPLSKHLNALMEAQAAECVAKSDGDAAFFKYTTTVFSRSKSSGTTFNQADMVAIAKELGFNSEAVNTCVTNETTKPIVDGGIAEANKAGIRGTPGTYIRKLDGSLSYVVGAVDISVFRTVIDGYLR